MQVSARGRDPQKKPMQEAPPRAGLAPQNQKSSKDRIG